MIDRSHIYLKYLHILLIPEAKYSCHIDTSGKVYCIVKSLEKR